MKIKATDIPPLIYVEHPIIKEVLEPPEPDKKKIRFNKKLIVFIILLNVIFTASVFYASLHQATIPDSLIIAWYSFTTTELIAMAGIKMRGDKSETL